jgi:hypothetical protein
MGTEAKLPWVDVQNAIVRRFKMSWVWDSIYHE